MSKYEFGTAANILKEEADGYKPSVLSEWLDADSFLNLLELVRQVLRAGKLSEIEYGIIVRSKAEWTALQNASDFYKSKGI